MSSTSGIFIDKILSPALITIFLISSVVILSLIYLQTKAKDVIEEQRQYDKSHKVYSVGDYERMKRETTREQLQRLQQKPEYLDLIQKLQRRQIPSWKDLQAEEIVFSDEEDEIQRKKK